MPDSIVQVQYDQLTQLVNRINQQAEQVQQLHALVQQHYRPLVAGDWLGRGSQAFFHEMDGEIYPALKRLYSALLAGHDVLGEMGERLRHAEEEAARLFGGYDASGDVGIIDSPPMRIPDQERRSHPNTGDMNLPETATPEIPVEQIFSDQYMTGLIGIKIAGMNNPELNNAMETLLKPNLSDAERQATLAEIAKIRGLSSAEIQAQYERFQALQKSMGGNPIDGIDLNRHPNFLGNAESMRYGKVVGDALGIDPVFGSLLNPTGGIVGSGNAEIKTGLEAVKYHGVVHDAAGFLYNHFNKMGPGYKYLDTSSSSEGRSNPIDLAGQGFGIGYWLKKVPPSLSDILSINRNLESSVDTMVTGAIEDSVHAVGEHVKRGYDTVVDWFDDLF